MKDVNSVSAPTSNYEEVIPPLISALECLEALVVRDDISNTEKMLWIRKLIIALKPRKPTCPKKKTKSKG